MEKTETMKKITNIDITFVGIDFWNRPVYKVHNMDVYIGSLDTLFPHPEYGNTPQDIDNYFKNNLDELVIFGNTFDEQDPLGTRIKKSIKLNII